jgi:exosortase A-associated hydrolase 1
MGKSTSAVIALPAGGPQYRVGMGRQLLQMAEYFAQRGVAVLRFDYRGIGDSEGNYLGYKATESDLRSAIKALKSSMPHVQDIFLWGGCNAASAIMMYAWKFPEIKGFAVSNPFLGNGYEVARARQYHYMNRVKEREFWVKLISGKYNLISYLKSFLNHVFRKVISLIKNAEKGAPLSSDAEPSVAEMMLDGVRKLNGEIVIFLSGKSVQSQAFSAMLDSSPEWKKEFSREGFRVVSLPDADQAFSELKERKKLISIAHTWLCEVTA